MESTGLWDIKRYIQGLKVTHAECQVTQFGVFAQICLTRRPHDILNTVYRTESAHICLLQHTPHYATTFFWLVAGSLAKLAG